MRIRFKRILKWLNSCLLRLYVTKDRLQKNSDSLSVRDRDNMDVCIILSTLTILN